MPSPAPALALRLARLKLWVYRRPVRPGIGVAATAMPTGAGECESSDHTLAAEPTRARRSVRPLAVSQPPLASGERTCEGAGEARSPPASSAVDAEPPSEWARMGASAPACCMREGERPSGASLEELLPARARAAAAARSRKPRILLPLPPLPPLLPSGGGESSPPQGAAATTAAAAAARATAADEDRLPLPLPLALALLPLRGEVAPTVGLPAPPLRLEEERKLLMPSPRPTFRLKPCPWPKLLGAVEPLPRRFSRLPQSA